jgi:hypothetical protein
MSINEKRYVVAKITEPVPLVGDPVAVPWKKAAVLNIDQFPWYKSGDRQGTTVRLLYDDQAVYAQFICQDKHSYAVATKVNDPVYRDSCVEFFGSIDPAARPDYFNLEMNCCGTLLMGFNGSRANRAQITPELASKIKLVTSVPGPTKEESPADNGWWAAVRLPFEVISDMAGQKVRPTQGTTWRANFYRCGGKTDTQYGCWSPIDTIKYPVPDFHRPEYFGTLIFG